MVTTGPEFVPTCNMWDPDVDVWTPMMYWAPGVYVTEIGVKVAIAHGWKVGVSTPEPAAEELNLRAELERVKGELALREAELERANKLIFGTTSEEESSRLRQLKPASPDSTKEGWLVRGLNSAKKEADTAPRYKREAADKQFPLGTLDSDSEEHDG